MPKGKKKAESPYMAGKRKKAQMADSVLSPEVNDYVNTVRQVDSARREASGKDYSQESRTHAGDSALFGVRRIQSKLRGN